jgi:hypothetical protein
MDRPCIFSPKEALIYSIEDLISASYPFLRNEMNKNNRVPLISVKLISGAWAAPLERGGKAFPLFLFFVLVEDSASE